MVSFGTHIFLQYFDISRYSLPCLRDSTSNGSFELILTYRGILTPVDLKRALSFSSTSLLISLSALMVDAINDYFEGFD
jgi:hypothetical protein